MICIKGSEKNKINIELLANAIEAMTVEYCQSMKMKYISDCQLKLRSIKSASGFSQERIGVCLGTSQSQVSFLANGDESRFSIEKLKILKFQLDSVMKVLGIE